MTKTIRHFVAEMILLLTAFAPLARGQIFVAAATDLTSCLPMINPSFVVDSFTIFPGYVGNGGANGPITGWTSVGNVGINPVAGATAATPNPFADNGTIPDGKQVAFMQEDRALSQVVGGFTVGAEYHVQYYENSRGWNEGSVPFIEVTIGGATIVPAHPVSPVGGSNPYHHVTSSTFIATATSLELAFIKSNPQGGDTTALIDNVCIALLNLPVSPECPDDKTVNCSDPWSFDPPTFADACGPATVTVLDTVSDGSCPERITRTWSVTNACGADYTCSQTVTVEDTTPPVLVCARDKTVECGTDWDLE